MFVGPLYFYLCKFFNSLSLLWDWFFINCMNSSNTKNVFWYCYFGWLENLKILWLQILRNFCWIKWIKHQPKGIAESTRKEMEILRYKKRKENWNQADPAASLGIRVSLSYLDSGLLHSHAIWDEASETPQQGADSEPPIESEDFPRTASLEQSQWNKSRKFICFAQDSDRKKNFLLPHRKTANPQSTCHNRRDDAICRDSEKNITMVLLGTLLEINTNHYGETQPVPRKHRIL